MDPCAKCDAKLCERSAEAKAMRLDDCPPDPCWGELPGVLFACCGHGKEPGYILFENGVHISFNLIDVSHWTEEKLLLPRFAHAVERPLWESRRDAS